MVRALLPTPPPPTTTSLNRSSSPLIINLFSARESRRSPGEAKKNCLREEKKTKQKNTHGLLLRLQTSPVHFLPQPGVSLPRLRTKVRVRRKTGLQLGVYSHLSSAAVLLFVRLNAASEGGTASSFLPPQENSRGKANLPNLSPEQSVSVTPPSPASELRPLFLRRSPKLKNCRFKFNFRDSLSLFGHLEDL